MTASEEFKRLPEVYSAAYESGCSFELHYEGPCETWYFVIYDYPLKWVGKSRNLKYAIEDAIDELKRRAASKSKKKVCID
jgi:hypothetical protein